MFLKNVILLRTIVILLSAISVSGSHICIILLSVILLKAILVSGIHLRVVILLRTIVIL